MKNENIDQVQERKRRLENITTHNYCYYTYFA